MTTNRSSVRRILVLTPGIAGADGVAAVSRSVLNVLAEDGATQIEAMALADVQPWAGPEGRTRQRMAGGSKLRLVGQALRSACAGRRPDLVLVLHLHLAPLALPWLARGVHCAVFLHGIEAWQPLRRREIAVLKHSLLLANSQATADQFRKAHAEFAEVPVTVTHLGIAAQVPPPVPCRKVEGGFILIAGRMHVAERYKGHDQLIDIWPQLLQAFPEVRLVVAGEGNDRERLQARVAAMGLERSICFTGAVSDEELSWLYQNCRFFAMPSRGEGFGLVFLEAMRAGKACLGGIGAAGEIILDGQTGILVDPARPERLLHALNQLFSAPALTDSMGQAGRQRFLENFTEEQFGHRLRRALGLGRPTGSSCAASSD